jgi:hypothetical protein
MRPDLDELLASIRRALVEFVAPEVTSVYARTELTYALSLLAALSRETGDAAAELMAQNAALRRLLGESAALLAGSGIDAGLLADLDRAVGGGSEDVTLPALRAEAAGLFDLLVRLQATCEDAPRGDAVAAVYDETVSFLRRRAERQAGMRR